MQHVKRQRPSEHSGQPLARRTDMRGARKLRRCVLFEGLLVFVRVLLRRLAIPAHRIGYEVERAPSFASKRSKMVLPTRTTVLQSGERRVVHVCRTKTSLYTAKSLRALDGVVAPAAQQAANRAGRTDDGRRTPWARPTGGLDLA